MNKPEKMKKIQTGKSGDGIEFINTLQSLEKLEDLLPAKCGFFDLPKIKRCNDREHEPPKYLYIPQGKGYKHVCPTCGSETIMIPQQISFKAKSK